MAVSTFSTLEKVHQKAGGPFNGVYGVCNQIMYGCFNRKWNFAPCFFKFYSFRVLGTGRTL